MGFIFRSGWGGRGEGVSELRSSCLGWRRGLGEIPPREGNRTSVPRSPEEKLGLPSGRQDNPLMSCELCRPLLVSFEWAGIQPGYMCHLANLEIDLAMHLGLQVAMKMLMFINFQEAEKDSPLATSIKTWPLSSWTQARRTTLQGVEDREPSWLGIFALHSGVFLPHSRQCESGQELVFKA